ncbi:unnamed protein product [Closterium sp. Yama58-4]|nr:unnamed protein product [Closterium sp. Yama58-4]
MAQLTPRQKAAAGALFTFALADSLSQRSHAFAQPFADLPPAVADARSGAGNAHRANVWAEDPSAIRVCQHVLKCLSLSEANARACCQMASAGPSLKPHIEKVGSKQCTSKDRPNDLLLLHFPHLPHLPPPSPFPQIPPISFIFTFPSPRPPLLLLPPIPPIFPIPPLLKPPPSPPFPSSPSFSLLGPTFPLLPSPPNPLPPALPPVSGRATAGERIAPPSGEGESGDSGGVCARTGLETAAAGAGEAGEGAEAVKGIPEDERIAILWELLTAFMSDERASGGSASGGTAGAGGTAAGGAGGGSGAGDAAAQGVQGGGYDSRERTALRLLALWLQLDWSLVAAMERLLATAAYNAQVQIDQAAAAAAAEKAKAAQAGNRKWGGWGRAVSIGAAAVGTGALLAVTGGLAAPVLLAGMSAAGSMIPVAGGIITGAAALAGTTVGSAAVIGAFGGEWGREETKGSSGCMAALAIALCMIVLAGTTVGSAAVIGAFGAAGARMGSYKMARRLGDVEEFKFVPLANADAKLSVAVVAAGYVLNPKDFVEPWLSLPTDTEQFAVVWQSADLITSGRAINDWLMSTAVQRSVVTGGTMVAVQVLGAASLWPITLLTAAATIDDKWSVAVNRTDKAGAVLADVLLERTQGSRPVTLIGFSLGARLIFSCLTHLAAKGHAAMGVVERAVLLGAPVAARDSSAWEAARRVVSGRLVNGYCENDWALGLMYRTSFLLSGVAGIQAVKVKGVENVNLTPLVDGHTSYLSGVPAILDALSIDSPLAATPADVLRAAKEWKAEEESLI